MKKGLLGLALTGLMLPMASQAAFCTKSGHIERVTQYADGISNYSYIYMRTSALSNVWQYFRTTDDNVASSAVSALASTTRVTMSGETTATSCPSSGYQGDLRYLIVNP